MNTVPIDANRTINRFALIRNISQPLAGKVLNMDMWDKFAVDAMLKCAHLLKLPGSKAHLEPVTCTTRTSCVRLAMTAAILGTTTFELLTLWITPAST